MIRQCKTWFNIDDDRVFLLGHSMGGFGAYQHLLRSPDRFAAVIANSGSWSQAYWPAISGTPLCTVQGVHDARPGVRWHYTDIAYGRSTDTILNRLGLDHLYLEQDGNHSIAYGRPLIARYLEYGKGLRRDPYYPHVVLASPQGFSAACSYPVEDNRWLTLDKSKPGDIEYDELIPNRTNDFNDWKLSHYVGKHQRRGDRCDQRRPKYDRRCHEKRTTIHRLAPSEHDQRRQTGDDRRQRQDSIQRSC